MSAVREDIIASAVKFLQDPKVQSSPLGKRVAFLESKGLTSQEIEVAMARANGTASSSEGVAGAGAGAGAGASAVTAVPVQQMMVPHQGPGQVMMAPPLLPPKYDWKDMFIAAVVAGGFSYGMWQITKKFVGPKLQWPSQEDLALDKKKLDEQFEEIEKSLAEVKESTTVVAKNVEDQTAHVKESLEGMTGVLDGMKSNDNKREQELAGLKTDIENIKDMIPKLMEKNKESQSTTLNDLQTEIKSLKSLLLSRRTGPPGSAGPSTSSGSPAPWSAAASFSSQNMTASTVKSDDAAMNFLNTKASIPAWQLAAQKNAANNSESTLSTSTDGTDSTANNA
ncbi:peroxisomal membrane anchor protein conserved region-domain-containing protein [Gamsiella multidivaricata]|uniref:peroxisomal membrane anchor protein conserved region-domain-containing protein n=1 Tax=Gamsiella multidivaricata TaxID=101098 RepID=UPI00221F66A8|nr:peroxisomal membrane anchor protein conserved region-domain-containing protein [Gamsiella multidivaricata]KAG0368516.1 peroxisomal membrane protein pex14 [Gamsiella multidivaricata]KAI7821325.1 peroxisomal membrane anchor protein conserved region-domain-containing protein [Gamsiella multidivaricata]